MELWGVKPNLMLIIIICFSLLRGSVGGAVIGLFSGILMDFFAAAVFGLHSLLCMYTGVVTGSLSSRFVRENYLVAVLFTFVLSFVYESIFFFLRFYMWGETQIVFFLKNTILLEAVYNCILVIPVYYSIIRINKWLERKEEVTRKY